jgi:hypothetical protein
VLLVFFGPNCSGKTSVGRDIARRTGATVWIGRDYLRLAKDEASAWQHFQGFLSRSVEVPTLGFASIIYVPVDFPGGSRVVPSGPGLRFVRFTADLEVLKSRFAERVGGRISPTVEGMIKRSLEDAGRRHADLEEDTSRREVETIATEIIAMWGKPGPSNT